MKKTGASSKRRLIEQAVIELVETRKRKPLADLIGTGVFGISETELRRRRHQKHARKK